jgi:hypothetical protein
MEEVEVVVAHSERATLRVGDVFLKIDADQTRTDVEVEAMAMAPVPTPEVLWRKPPVLALAALTGTALGRLGEPSTASPAAWAAAGAAVRMLHDAPLPPWPGRRLDEIASELDGECQWLITNDVSAVLACHGLRSAVLLDLALHPAYRRRREPRSPRELNSPNVGTPLKRSSTSTLSIAGTGAHARLPSIGRAFTNPHYPSRAQ